MTRVLHYIPDLGRGGAETQLVHNVRYADPKRFQHVVCYGGPPTDHVEELRELGAEVIEVGRGTRPWSIKPALKIRRIIRSRKIDLVHIGLFPTRFGLAAAISTRTPAVTTIPTTFENAEFDKSKGRSLFGRMKRKLGVGLQAQLAKIGSGRFIAISETVKLNASRTLNIDEDRFDVIYRGLVPENFEKKTSNGRDLAMELGLSDSSLILLTTGRLIGSKGHIDLMKMMVSLVSDFPSAHLLICGKGPLREELEAERDRFGLAESVTFLGFRTDIAELNHLADAFVFASRYEGLGNSLVEASAAGTPIVAYDIPVIREIVEHGKSGLIVKERSPQLLAEAVKQIVSEPEIAVRMAERGPQIARERFDIRKNVLLTERVYDKVLAVRQHTVSVSSPAD